MADAPDHARHHPPPTTTPFRPPHSTKHGEKDAEKAIEDIQQRIQQLPSIAASRERRMPHQQPHKHTHHEPSRNIQRKNVVAAAPTDVINPRILDASLRDVTERLSAEQKAEVLIHAMNLLKLAKCVPPLSFNCVQKRLTRLLCALCVDVDDSPFSHHIVENGVMSCLQAANLGTPQRVQALLLRGRARMASGELSRARQGASLSSFSSVSCNAHRPASCACEDLYQVLEIVPEHAVAKSLLSIPILNQNTNGTARDVRPSSFLPFFPFFRSFRSWPQISLPLCLRFSRDFTKPGICILVAI